MVNCMNTPRMEGAAVEASEKSVNGFQRNEMKL